MADSIQKPRTYAGIDVSGKELVLSMRRSGSKADRHAKLTNDATGHKKLLRMLTKAKGLTRVVLEATGVHHFDVALALDAHPRVQLMVANPLATRRFAQAQMCRAKTDKVDGASLLEFCVRMEFEPWQRPTDEALELRALSRHMGALIKAQTAAKNRLKAARGTDSTPAFVIDDLLDQIAAHESRIAACEKEMARCARSHPELAKQVDHLDSMPGVALRSALQLVAELQFLDPDMTPDQVVAHAGLDPRPVESGKRTGKRKISKMGNAHLRRILYFPAMTAVRTNPVVGAWSDRLEAKGKPALLVQTAVARRMLRVAWVLLKRGEDWVDAKFAPVTSNPAPTPV